MVTIPNEHIVQKFSSRDKGETLEQGERLDAAGAKDMKSANDFLTRYQEPSVNNQKDKSNQIGFN